MNQLDIKKKFYKFKTLEKHYILNYWIDSINFHYNNYNFRQICIIFDQIDTSVFISPDDKNYIFNTYYSNLVLKRIIEKIKIKYRNYKKSKYSINNQLLNLSDININDNEHLTKFNYYIDLPVVNKKQFYRFNVYELIKLFKTSLSNQYFGIPDPSIPIHPYIGTEFNISQIIFIFSHLLKFNLPLELYLFKSSSYNIDNLLENHRNYFLYKSSTQYVIELNDNDWLNLLKEWYKKCNIKKIACWKCLNELSNLRNIIQPIIIQYIYESNSTDVSIKSNEMILEFSKNYNLEQSYKHPIKHVNIPKKYFEFIYSPNNHEFDYSNIIKFENTKVFIFKAGNKTKSSISKKRKNLNKKNKKKSYYEKNFKTFDLFKNNYSLSSNINQHFVNNNINTGIDTTSIEESFDIPPISIEENIVIENTCIDIENTTAENTAIENTVIDNTVIDNTAIENTAIDNTVIDNTAIENTGIENTAIENTVIDNTTIDNVVIENTSEENITTITNVINNLQNDIQQIIETNVIQTNEIREINNDDIENFNSWLKTVSNLYNPSSNPDFQLLYNLYVNPNSSNIKKFENMNKNRVYADIIKKNDIPIYCKLWNGNLLWIDKKNHNIYNPSSNQLQIIGKLYMQKLIGCPEDNIYNFITKIDTSGIWNIDTDQPEFKEPEIDN